MGSLGLWEVVTLAVLALLIFGPERLPGIAQNVGRIIAAFKREASSTLDELKAAADLDDVRDVARDLRGTTAELKRSLDVTGPIASPARPRSSNGSAGPVRAVLPAAAGAESDDPPPFDAAAT